LLAASTRRRRTGDNAEFSASNKRLLGGRSRVAQSSPRSWKKSASDNRLKHGKATYH
jgi:hypothetical protein